MQGIHRAGHQCKVTQDPQMPDALLPRVGGGELIGLYNSGSLGRVRSGIDLQIWIETQDVSL